MTSNRVAEWLSLSVQWAGERSSASSNRAALDAGRTSCYMWGAIGPARMSAGRYDDYNRRKRKCPVYFSP